MKRLLLIFLFINSFLYSQNLVLNPGFEAIDSFRFYAADNWYAPSAGTTDFYNYGDDRDLSLFGGRTKAHSGKGFAGLILYQESGYREFCTGQFASPLEAGKTYYLDFFMEMGKKCKTGTDNMQLYFSVSEPGKAMKKSQAIAKQQPQLEINITDVTSAPGIWKEVRATYVAAGGELYFTIGNFHDNKKTSVITTKVPSGGAHYWAYYYLDDFFIGENELPSVESDSTEDWPYQFEDTSRLYALEPHDSLHIEAGKKLVLQNIYFETDKAVILDSSYAILNEIASELKAHPELNMEIDGFTDGTGTAAHNNQLSLDRANAVATFFVNQGIQNTRITSKGYGSSLPLVAEKTDADRAMNRRVEFIFSK